MQKITRVDGSAAKLGSKEHYSTITTFYVRVTSLSHYFIASTYHKYEAKEHASA